MKLMRIPWYAVIVLACCGSLRAQLWSGVLSPARATDWTAAGVIGGIPSGSWSQCGSTISPYGSSGSPSSPAAIQTTVNNCGTNQYVLLGSGDFYLSGPINMKSNVELRGMGADFTAGTRLHFIGNFSSCNGNNGVVCFQGSGSYGGYCDIGTWPCATGHYQTSGEQMANWTAGSCGFSQGTTCIVLDNVTNIIPNVTPIVLDQCDTGFVGAGSVYCNGAGTSGAITSAIIGSNGGGSGYQVGDTGTITPQTFNGGRSQGGQPLATYRVTGLGAAGAVTSFAITNGGAAYTYTDYSNTAVVSGFVNQTYNSTVATSGSGAGFSVQITGISSYDVGPGGFFVNAVPLVGTYQSSGGTARSGRSQSEVVLATAITNNGNGTWTVTIDHPIIHPNWALAQGPQAWWTNTAITNAGVRNVYLDLTGFTGAGGQSAVGICEGASNIWVQGIASTSANYFHVKATQAVTHYTIRDSYFYWTKYGSTTSYGVGAEAEAGNCLIENNIIQGVVDPVNINGSATGCVISYNFAVNQWDTASNVMFAAFPQHAAGTDYILTEGNIGSGVMLDQTHGTHMASTYYRNYFVGYETNNGITTSNATAPVIIEGAARFHNFVGNVLGTPSYHTVYQCVPASSSEIHCTTDTDGTNALWHHIWDIGYSNGSQIDRTNLPTTPNDLRAVSSLMRWGNWDNVSGFVQWNPSEVPTRDPGFPVSVPPLGGSGGPLPASFIYSSKPSWWPTGKTWPAIGPDVSTGNIGQCTGGTYPLSKATTAGQCTGGVFLSPVLTTGSHAVSIPAMDCYFTMGGRPDGAGNMLSFNANSCYASGAGGGGGGGGGSLSPPTAVSAVAR